MNTKLNNAPALQIYPYMCEQQRTDLEFLLKAVDEFGGTTLALANQGPQGYATFIEARDTLRNNINDMASKYRIVL